MPRYTIEIDESKRAKAEEMAAYFKMPVEALLKECAELGMEGKGILMENMKADPLGQGDPVRGGEWRSAVKIADLKRRGLWQA